MPPSEFGYLEMYKFSPRTSHGGRSQMDTMNATGSKFSTYNNSTMIEKPKGGIKSRNDTRAKMVNTMQASPRPVSMAENVATRKPLEKLADN